MPDFISRYLSNVMTVDKIEALTNKTIDGNFNTFANIPPAALDKITDKTKLHDDIVYKDVPNQLIEQHADVDLQGLQDGDRLTWDADNSQWINVQPAAAVLGQVLGASNVGAIGANVFYQRNVDDILEFSKLTSLNSGLTIVNDGDLVKFNIDDASTTIKGLVQLALSTESVSTKAVRSTDTRLTNSRFPTDHSEIHENAGGDTINLDTLGPTSDNTLLNATTSKHGLMQKYPGGTSTFLRGDGTFATPSTTTSSVYNRQMVNNTINTTTVKTILYQTTILANAMGPDGILECEIYCDYLNDSGGNALLELYFEFGATTLFQDQLGSYGTDPNRRVFKINFFVANNAETNSQEFWGDVRVSDPTSVTSGLFGQGNLDDDEIATDSPIGGNSNEDTTTNKNLTVYIKHNVSSAVIEIRRRAAFTKLM